MAQGQIWEKEYQKPQLVSSSFVPTLEFKKFVKFLKKTTKRSINEWSVLDLGCGNGKNSLYLAERGASVVGVDISPTAIRIAKAESQKIQLSVQFKVGNIGKKLEFKANQFNVALDIMSSNSLSAPERQTFLSEVARVLQPGGWLFVKALARDHDRHTQELLRKYPGPEEGSYIFPNIGLIEHAFSKLEFEEFYSRYFDIVYMAENVGYTSFQNKKYKRHYFTAYLHRR